MTESEQARLIAHLYLEWQYLTKHPIYPSLVEKWKRISNDD